MKNKIVAVVLAAILPISLTNSVSAAEKSTSAPVTSTKNSAPDQKIMDHELTQEEAHEAEAAIEKLFTKFIQQDPSGKWVVNEEAARAEKVDTSQLKVIAEDLNKEQTQEHSIKSREYRRCVLNSVGMGTLAGAANSAGSYINWLIMVKRWDELAWVLARVIGVNALKGGVAGAAATLAAAGAWCATPWAS